MRTMTKMMLAATVAAAGLSAAPAFAAYTINIQQVGNNVVATGTGSVLTVGGRAFGSGSADSRLAASYPYLYLGTGRYDLYALASPGGPTNFGIGNDRVANSFTGNRAGFFFQNNTLSVLVPTGYISGSDAGTSTSTFNNSSLASLGLSIGTYTYNFGQGANADSFIVRIGEQAGAVPETATWGMMIAGLGMMGGAMRTRRRSTTVSFA